MKKLITSLVVASMVAISTPAFAEDYYGDRGERHHHHGGGGKWVAPLIGGIVIGALLSGSNKDRRPDYNNNYNNYDNNYYPPNYRYDQRYCVREQVVEWHGNERYIFWQTTCN